MTRKTRASAPWALGLVGVMALSGCSGDFISTGEQANRLISASAFGSLTANIRTVQSTDYPGAADRAAVERWLLQTDKETAAAQAAFTAWTAATAQLMFLPSNTPGPNKAGIEAFDAAYLNWYTGRVAYTRAIRKCLQSKKNRVARACQENVLLSSADTRLAADTALGAETANIELSLRVAQTSSASSQRASSGN